jgi:hypothetical protein
MFLYPLKVSHLFLSILSWPHHPLTSSALNRSHPGDPFGSTPHLSCAVAVLPPPNHSRLAYPSPPCLHVTSPSYRHHLACPHKTAPAVPALRYPASTHGLRGSRSWADAASQENPMMKSKRRRNRKKKLIHGNTRSRMGNSQTH